MQVYVNAQQQFVKTTDLSIHDPVMIKEEDTYYLLGTGRGITVWSSKDMENWQREKPVFEQPPKWAADTIPGFKGHIWAPDIHYHKGLYYVYYSVSVFGKNTSAIGVATNTTLNAASPAYKWTDHGRVIQSYPRVTDWNAIDANIVEAANGDAYMSFGSFWGGLQLVKLSADRLSIDARDNSIKKIASRSPGRENAIEAPFIFKKNGYYYLFASIDYCCKGVNSTYKIIVGRSINVAGPYTDKEGKDMVTGGGTIVLQGNNRWHGVGHNAVVLLNNTDYLVFHGYDGEQNGKSKLHIKKIEWDNEGWPAVKLTGETNEP